MKLIDPGAGELVDRVTILALKLLHGADGETAHFRNEQVKIHTMLRARTTMNGMWFESAVELAAVNGALWHSEDEIRRLRGVKDVTNAILYQAGQTGMYIQELNDRRAQLIEEINKAVGDFTGQEKVSP